MNKIIAAVSSPTMVDSVLDQVPGIDILLVPSVYYSNKGSNGLKNNFLHPVHVPPN